MSCDLIRRDRPNGFSLMECLVVVALVGILATLAIPSSSAVQRRLELDSGLRRLRVGLDRGRMAAERDRQPCSLQLTARVGRHGGLDGGVRKGLVDAGP